MPIELRIQQLLRLASTLLVLSLAGLPASAEPNGAKSPHIHTGGESGAYHLSFCPPLAKALEPLASSHICTPSRGSAENMARVAAEPRDLGFAQQDVLTLESGNFPPHSFTTIRADDVRECIFAVTRNKELTSFGDIAARSDQLRFLLPPEKSGSAGTFRYLQSIDGDLAHAASVRHTGDADEAIRLALAADDTVAIFVQFPDPDNKRFKLVDQLGGSFVPVVDRNILSRTIDGRFVYFAEETEVTDAGWTAKGQKLVTACTPLVLFTGNADRIADRSAAEAHSKLIEAIRALPADKLRPADGFFAGLLKRSRELSASAVETLVSVSETAREKASPLIEKAKEATAKALEGAKPQVEKAKETGAETIEKAKDAVKEFIDPTPPKEASGR